MSNPVNPDHYRHGELETIERMIYMFGPEAVKTFCQINAYKYTDRRGYKDFADIEQSKADWYLILAGLLDNYTDAGLACAKVREYLEIVRN